MTNLEWLIQDEDNREAVIYSISSGNLAPHKDGKLKENISCDECMMKEIDPNEFRNCYKLLNEWLHAEHKE